MNARNKVAVLVTVSVLAHLVVTLLHGRAHEQLAVGLTTWQNAYVMTVVLIAPLIAMVLAWLRRTRLGLMVLLLSMAGSLIFGVIYHYVIVSSDHVSHLPAGDAQSVFRTTALLLVLTELFGVVVGLFGLRQRVDSGL